MSHSKVSSQSLNSDHSMSHSSHPDTDLVFTNTPNLLTLVRILVVPVIVGLLMVRTDSTDVAAGLLFTAAGITDYLDGYLGAY